MNKTNRALIIFGHKTASEVLSAAKLGYQENFDSIRTFVYQEDLSKNDEFTSILNSFHDIFFIAAIIDFKLKPDVVEFAKTLNLKPFSIIHPTAFIDESARIGEGVFVGPQSVISANASIGNHSVIHIHSSIGHDARIGDYCAILPGARISGDVIVQDSALIGSNSFVYQGTCVGRNARVDALTYVKEDVLENKTISCRLESL